MPDVPSILRETMSPTGPAYDSVIPDRHLRRHLEIPAALISDELLALRHKQEPAGNHAASVLRASDAQVWNHPSEHDWIELIEFNWLADGQWSRVYGHPQQGIHRIQRAIELGLEAVWIEVSEERFYPKGERPPDRRSDAGS